MACQDINGNAVDCTDPSAIYSVDSSGYLSPNPAQGANPVAAMSTSPFGNGGSSLTSFFSGLGGLAQSISQAAGVTAPTPSRPSTFKLPTANQTIAGGSSILVLGLALVVAFLLFRKKGA